MHCNVVLIAVCRRIFYFIKIFYTPPHFHLYYHCGENALFLPNPFYFRFFTKIVPAKNAVKGAVAASPKLPATVLMISAATWLLFKML